MSAPQLEPSRPIDSVVTAIVRRVDKYLESMAEVRTEHPSPWEETLLEQFEIYTADVLDRYWPTGRRDRESLDFADLYQWQKAKTADDRFRAMIAALMAAEVESRGPLRLTPSQNARLAAIFERIGAQCRADKLYLHAALAFDRAAGIHLLLGENVARDRCLYQRSRARQKSMMLSVKKVFLGLGWAVCGYGYKPYWLLLWVLVELAAFTIGLVLVLPGTPWDRVQISLSNYLDPHDAIGLHPVAGVLLLLESYVSLVSVSVFFALLVHRWFRI